IENQELEPQMYSKPIFDKAGKSIQWKNDSLLSKWCWENCTATCRGMKLDDMFTPHTKINSKLMKDLNVRQETIKALEEKTGNNLFDLFVAATFYTTLHKNELLGLHQDKKL
ncbi:LORF2 protein, partial [Crocuta crocuta]